MDIQKTSFKDRVTDWVRARLPSREALAAVTVLTLGWGLEYNARTSRIDLGAFGATAKASVVNNSGWDARLNSVSLTVASQGKYTADLLRDGKIVQTQSFSVGDIPEFVTFENVEPRGGLGGVITPGGKPSNFGYGYGNHSYEMQVTGSNGGEATTVKARL
jgi:hypothetical protein